MHVAVASDPRKSSPQALNEIWPFEESGVPPLLICVRRVATPMLLLLIHRIISVLLLLLLLISSPGSCRFCICIITRGVLHITGANIVSVSVEASSL